MNSEYFSPISIDLGAKYTGVLFNQFQAGQFPEKVHTEAELVVIPDKQNLTLSQADRRVKRHQRRGVKRLKMAKRLLKLILKHRFNLDIDHLNDGQKLKKPSMGC